ncbi:replication protein A [Methanococcoides methylutens]|uniref:Replication protein A (Two OB fold, one zinc finger) n=1 Tax=Methanococcoides methylutens MM1 TaxID=1434104 RepID=A0A0E3SS31_METMT|nr:replication protein A [Methanococcoides methylutens]AKB85906.1 Replication protein A (two OB fold, one zinc finger) [Methanococcoides methylutens MM1]
MDKTAENIKNRFLELGVDIPIENITERLDKLITKFKVPLDEARRSVIAYFLKEYNIDRNDFFASSGSTPLVKINEANEGGKWVNVRGKVVQLWDNSHESVSQVGLIGDDTGTIKFIKWARDDIPDIQEGNSYQFNNVVINEWNGRFEITLNKNTVIEEISDDINVVSNIMSSPGEGQPAPMVDISDITEDGKWISMRVKLSQLWDNTHESISQVGLIGDATGTIKFIKWTSADLPDFEEGKSYLLNNVVAQEWNDRFEVTLNKNSSIEELDEDVEVGNSSLTFSGVMVDVQSGSGLIKRCPECNRALTKGACMEHGKVDGVYDLRIKAVIDDGNIAQEAILKRDLAEQLSGMTLDEAISMAADALDQGVVLDQMRLKLLGRYFTVTGSKMDRYILVDSIEDQAELNPETIDELISEAEVL